MVLPTVAELGLAETYVTSSPVGHVVWVEDVEEDVV